MRTSVYILTKEGFKNKTSELSDEIKEEITPDIAYIFQNNMLTKQHTLVWVVQNNETEV